MMGTGVERLDKKEIYAHIIELEEQMGQMYADLGQLKEKLVHLLEENQRLSLENDRLRSLLKTEEDGRPENQDINRDEKPAVGEGYDNLARLYNEGFHICNVYYGHLRTEGDCLFCLSFLSK